MADTRINALSTATSSASDDYLAIDGTTNGTRKLSAYSPSFGGNATVGGTLTVSGSGTSAIGGMLKGAAATYSGNPPTGVTSAFQVDVENATTRDVLSFGDASRAGLLRGYHDGSGGIRWQFGRYAGGAYDEYARFEGTTAANGKLLIYGTTASTSTSSGALVVSGGVGVAEQIHAKYYTATSNIVAGFTANTHVLDYYSGTARNVVFGPDASTIGNWKLQLLRSDASASIDALTVSNAGNGVFYGSVKTAAPSGGTSAAWKLGTVATVSPTSPNRTIEVDIGGTTYYIHAKTTNN